MLNKRTIISSADKDRRKVRTRSYQATACLESAPVGRLLGRRAVLCPLALWFCWAGRLELVYCLGVGSFGLVELTLLLLFPKYLARCRCERRS